MSILIFASIFGVLFMLLGTSSVLEKNYPLTHAIAVLLAALLVVVGVLEFLDLPILSYQNPFLLFRSYERIFMVAMSCCLVYFLLQSKDDLRVLSRTFSEQVALLFFVMAGGAILVSVNNLLLLFLGIEIVSLPLYVLTGLKKNNLKSNEATLKYFLIGAFFTGILLMGIALLYASIGSFDMPTVAAALDPSKIIQLMGITFILAAFAFKVSAVPFHFWTPDAYEGAPTPYTGFMASVAKSFFFLAFIRIFYESFANSASVWSPQVEFLIVLTLIVSNLVALSQNGIKRLMSYSSIAQAAFMLLAIYGTNRYGHDGLFIYAITYTLAVLGIFAIITPIHDKPIEHLNGLLKTHPVRAVALAVFVFSLAGIPFTGGFIGKYYMILSAIATHIPWLILVVIFITSAMSVFYYLRIIGSAFFKEPSELATPFPISRRFDTLLVINAIIIILLGIFPSWILQLINY